MNFGTGWVVCAIAELWRRIVSRIRRMELGNPGAVRQLGGGLAEMKVDYGPGYRIYFVERNKSIILLLCGGDKSTQRRDIDRARGLAEELRR
jgi:putative addiction module killer protein